MKCPTTDMLQKLKGIRDKGFKVQRISLPQKSVCSLVSIKLHFLWNAEANQSVVAL